MKKILSIATTLLCVLSASVQANNALSFSTTTKQAGLTLDKISPNTTLSFNTPKTSQAIAHANTLDKRLKTDLKRFEQTTSKKQNLSRLSMSENVNFLFAKPLPSPTQPQWMILRLSGGVTLPQYKFSNNFVDEFSAFYDGEISYTTSQKLGFQVGAGIGFKTSDKFQLLLMPSYSRQGCKYSSNENALLEVTDNKGNPIEVLAFATFDETVDAIKVPIVARWNLGGERFGVTLGAGLSGNYSFKGQRDPIFETESKSYPEKTQVLKFGSARTDNYRSFDVSTLLHSGVYFVLDEQGRKRLTFSMDYEMGMKNLQTDVRTNFLSAQGIETTGSRKNRSLNFSIGIEIWPVW